MEEAQHPNRHAIFNVPARLRVKCAGADQKPHNHDHVLVRVPLAMHMPAHESSGSHIIGAHGGVLAGRRRQGRKSGGQGRGTGGFEEADPDRDHCGEAGD